MSDEPRGREYLEKVRPDAMKHLMAFFRESGRHLDPKTRFLISIVTKTINFSPRGLRQYVRRAMESGATTDEVIDAILCSYPCSGLTRVCDAMTVVLDMKIPGVTEGAPAVPAAAPEAGGWTALEGAALPAEGKLARYEAGGTAICVTRKEGVLHAVGDVCPHRGGSLSAGHVADGAVVCPLHGWSFRPEDGRSAGIGRGGAAVFEIRESAGRAEVRAVSR
ncbi:MAG: Rieske 2Fe-2S domain-containing protein [Candidatus Brocadiae bacterium]|nr:Rieske 2Fe-2S domain-containing protein [Candidatus Brocadiia bacterium]